MGSITPTDPIYAAFAIFAMKYLLGASAAYLAACGLVAIVRHMMCPRRKGAVPRVIQLF